MKLPDSVHVERRGLMTLYLSDGVGAPEVIDSLQKSGSMLKNGNKRVVRRVGNWVIKTTNFNKGVGPFKLTTNRARYRNGWLASLAMEAHGVAIPKTIAYVEYGFAGIILSSAFVFEFLEGCKPLPIFAKTVYEEDATKFFEDLNGALQKLTEARIYHHDLKPVNILTADGKTFYFIDFDDVVVGVEPLVEHRLRNHTQITAGVSRVCGEEELNTFLRMGVPDGEDADEWIKRVWQGVTRRRETGERY
jgi:serine/threonine protein kinase